jgi:hypothetical protein
VNQTATNITVSPNTATVLFTNTQQFTAKVADQFGTALAVQPTVTWSVSSTSIGTVSTSGLFKAASKVGSVTVSAKSGALTGTATVSVKKK